MTLPWVRNSNSSVALSSLLSEAYPWLRESNDDWFEFRTEGNVMTVRDKREGRRAQ